MKRLNVAVLRGGPSDEYEYSLKTGAGVLNALADTEYKTQDIIIARNGDWLSGGYVKSPEVALATADVVFIALHGNYGEDGQVQRLLDRTGIPYTGSKALASSIAMNKALTKDHLKNIGVKLAPHHKMSLNNMTSPQRTAQSIADMFGPTYVLKPLKGGSSVGTMIVNSTGQLAKALEEMSKTYDEILIEQFISGKEVTLGVIENYRGSELYDLPAIEIKSTDTGIFNSEEKYQKGFALTCPACVSQYDKERLARYAKDIHRELNLRHYSRSDFIISGDDIYFLEVNTLPGLTETSLLPHSLAAVGGSYKDLIQHLLQEAVYPQSGLANTIY